MVFIIVLVVLLVVATLIINSYNSLVQTRALAQEAWSGVDIQLKRRYDLIPNLIETVKGYSIHEKSIIENLARARAISMGATGINEKELAEKGLTQSLKSLFALVENYPILKANESFLSLQKELSAIEHELQLSRRYYNGAVRNYIIMITQFPSTLIARTFGFNALPYFEINDSEQRDVPKVHF